MLGKCCEHLSIEDLPHLIEIRDNIKGQITKFENIDGKYNMHIILYLILPAVHICLSI